MVEHRRRERCLGNEHPHELDDLEQLDAHAQREEELRGAHSVHQLPVVAVAHAHAHLRGALALRGRAELGASVQRKVSQEEEAEIRPIHYIPRVSEVVADALAKHLERLEAAEEGVHDEPDREPEGSLLHLFARLDARLHVVRRNHGACGRGLEQQRHARAHGHVIRAQRHRDRERARLLVDEVGALEVVEELLDGSAHHAERTPRSRVVRVAKLVQVLPVPREAYAEVELARARRADLARAAPVEPEGAKVEHVVGGAALLGQ